MVQMILRHVAARGRSRVEIDASLQLQRRRFRHDDIPRLRFERVLRDRDADVSEHERVESSHAEHFARQRGGGRLSVRSRDAYEIRPGVPPPELDLGDDLDARFLRLPYERARHGDDRARHQKIDTLQKPVRFLAETNDTIRTFKLTGKPRDLGLPVVDDHPVPKAAQQLRSAYPALCHSDDERRLSVLLLHDPFPPIPVYRTHA